MPSKSHGALHQLSEAAVWNWQVTGHIGVSCSCILNTNNDFNSHFPGAPGLACSPLVSCTTYCLLVIQPGNTGIILSFATARLPDSWGKWHCIFHSAYYNIHTQHTTILRLCGICPGQLRWAGTRRNIHPLTLIVVINHPYLLSLLRSMASSLFNPHAWRSFSTISVQVFFGLALDPPLCTPNVFSPNHCLLFATRPFHRSLFCCNTEIMSSNSSLSQPFTADVSK